MKAYRFQTETTVDAPLDEVFEFFSNAANLQKLTPPTVSFKILTPLPIEMKQGALIDYQIRLHGIPMNWKTEISLWEPGVRFVDRQLKGPYRQWIHEHRFLAEGDQTRMFDTVDYIVPGGFLAPIPHALFVKREVEKIFEFREEALLREFPARAMA